jgi:hypothetical protein
LLSGIARFSRFYAGMRARERVGVTAPSWGAGTYRQRQRPSERRFGGVRRAEQRAKTTRLAIVVSLFLALLAAALLVSGPVTIDPMLRAAAEADANRVGDIVFTLPDGLFCRHFSFDNKTAELTEGAVEPCEQPRSQGTARVPNGFVWGAR